MSNIDLDIEDHTGRLPPDGLDFLRSRVLAAAQFTGVTGSLSVSIIVDQAMAAAHLKHSGISGTTDVLTFDLLQSTTHGSNFSCNRSKTLELQGNKSVFVSKSANVEAEILVCFDEAHRQCTKRKHLVEHEILLYIIHGLLHCIGFNDHDENNAAEMHKLEDAILTGIGVGPVFERHGDD